MPEKVAKTFTAKRSIEADVDIAISSCGGDARAAIRALIILLDHLSEELERTRANTSRGYVRKRIAPPR
ncbi:MAG: hypothetical protein JOY97_15530 [Hyphomicrobiales bacterium]|nr:hypothetical protein [Hyphomicrobiales bacterium]